MMAPAISASEIFDFMLDFPPRSSSDSFLVSTLCVLD